MAWQSFSKSGTGTYTQSSGLYSQADPFLRPAGVDLMGVQISVACTGWNSATVTATLEGCTVDTVGTTEPGVSQTWQTISSTTFTADATKYLDASGDFLVGTQGFQWLRVKFTVTTGSVTQNITLTYVTNADKEV